MKASKTPAPNPGLENPATHGNNLQSRQPVGTGAAASPVLQGTSGAPGVIQGAFPNPLIQKGVPPGQVEAQGPAKTTANPALGTDADNPTSVTLSRGIMQFITEGDFNGGENDSRMPHFPQNIAIFQKLSKDELSEEKGKKYTGNRYKGPDDIGRFAISSKGEFKLVSLEDRHAVGTYTQKLADDQQLGTTGGQSGVTIGFGLDLGNKWATTDTAKVKKYFTAGDVADDKADKLSQAAGIKGLKAAEKAATLRTEVELTHEQVFKVLKSAVSDLDKSQSFKRGDGTFHPVVEEVIFYTSYWGETSLGTAIKDGAKGKKAEEQIAAARDAVKVKLDALSKGSWKKKGYNSVYSLLAHLAEMADSGIEIKMSDVVMSKDELLASDDTFKVVRDVSERRDDYESAGKDLKDQISGTKLAAAITNSVGSSPKAKNDAEDVKIVQQLLYDGDYDVEVNGVFDDKTKAAVEAFAKKIPTKTFAKIEPRSTFIRHLKQFQYKTRTVVTPK